MSVTQRLLTGSFLRFASLIINVIVAFFMMPFVIHTLGDRWYGLWVIIGTLISYYSLLDLGLASASQRFFAHALPRNDPNELNTILTSSLTIFSALGLLALLVTAIAIGVGPLFMASTEDAHVFRIVTALMGFSVAMAFPFYVLTGLMTANLRYDKVSYLQIGKLILRTALSVWFLLQGYSVIALAVITVVVEVLGFVVLILLVRQEAPWINLRVRYFSRTRTRELFSFGGYAFLTSIADKVRFNIANFVIAAFVGLSAVTHYNIAMRLTEYFLQALGSLLGIMTPVFARYHAEGNHERLRESFMFASRVGALLGIFAGGSLIIFGQPFIKVWMGPEYADAYLPLAILVFAMTIDAMQIPTVNVLYAVAKHRFFAWMTVGDALVNVSLSLILVQSMGMVGVALAMALPMIVTKLVIQPWYVCRILEIPRARYYRQVIGPGVALAAIQLPLAFWVAGAQISSYREIFLWAICGYTVLLAVVAATIMSASERSHLVSLFKRIKT